MHQFVSSLICVFINLCLPGTVLFGQCAFYKDARSPEGVSRQPHKKSATPLREIPWKCLKHRAEQLACTDMVHTVYDIYRSIFQSMSEGISEY